jgi:predicted peptidase
MTGRKIFATSLAIAAAGLLVSTGLEYSQAQTDRPKPVPRIHTGMTARGFHKKLTTDIRGQYLLFLPENYLEESEKKFPLIVFLHGSGERGTRIGHVEKLGLPKVAPQREGFPFIMLAPQCPRDHWWEDAEITQMVMGMLDEVSRKYRVDPERVYLTGLSMGGFGTWEIATEFPERFAAIAPVCGGGNIYRVKRLKDVPARIYHGEKDTTVPVFFARQMAKALKKVGGKAQLVVFEDVGHNAWEKAYADDGLYEWLLKHSKKQEAEE